ncbi:MAG: sulfurtransferase [Acidobacteriota bacterium]|nr:MAG: sulfurtransferase [Acidobacteriota bacterium]
MHTTLISVDELTRNLGKPRWVIIDCRFSLKDTELGRQAYRDGHIPGAVYAHLDEDLSGPILPGITGRHPLPAPAEFVTKLEAWGVSNSSQVVVYDDLSGAIASRLWWMLNWVGHSAVAILDGGWSRWQAMKKPVATESVRPTASSFTPHLRQELFVSLEETETIRQNPRFRLVDAREAVRFEGKEEPIDRVAGHIPGAVSVPFAGNLSPDGTFLSPQQLRKRYEQILGGTPIENVVCYCGSGVTAAHDLVALAHAGLGLARLYAGSWSEWINDPARPVGRMP